MIVNNNSGSIDDDLHKELDFPNPAKEYHDQYWDTVFIVSNIS